MLSVTYKPLMLSVVMLIVAMMSDWRQGEGGLNKDAIIARRS
jgi:hypothetical protein